MITIVYITLPVNLKIKILYNTFIDAVKLFAELKSSKLHPFNSPMKINLKVFGVISFCDYWLLYYIKLSIDFIWNMCKNLDSRFLSELHTIHLNHFIIFRDSEFGITSIYSLLSPKWLLL